MAVNDRECAAMLERQQWEVLFGAAADAVSVHDVRSGNVLFVNECLCRRYGLSSDEALRAGPGIWSSGIPPYTAEAALERMKKAALEGPQFFQWLSENKSGGLFQVHVILTLTSVKSHAVLIAVLRNISTLPMVEEELMRTKEYLDTILNTIQDAVFLHELDGSIVTVNKRMLELYQVSQAEAPLLSIRDDYSSPENPLDDLPTIWRRVLGGENLICEWKARRPHDGFIFDVEVTFRRIPGVNRDLVLALVREAPGPRKVETELRMERHRFRTLCEMAPVGMVMVGPDDTHLYFNPKYVEMLGYDVDEMPTVDEWFHKAYPDVAYRRQVTEYWNSRVKTATPGSRKSFIRWVTCKNGQQKIVNFMPVELDSGCILMACEDITELKQTEDELIRRNTELEALNEIISSLNNSLQFTHTVGTLKDIFAEKLGVPSGGVFLYDEQTEELHMECSWGLPGGDAGRLREFVLARVDRERLMSLKEVHLLKMPPFDGEDADQRPPDSFGRASTATDASHLFVPVVVQGEVQGIVYMSGKESSTFSEGRLPFFKTLGRQIGVAMQNSRLFEEVKRSNSRMKALSLQLVEAQELERASMARELHDEVGQTLTVVKHLMDRCAGMAVGDESACFREAQAAITDLMAATRELSLRLRPAMLDDLGLLPTLLWHFERFTAQTGVKVMVKQSGLDQKRFSKREETTIYRIAQETLTNVARHARSKEVTVRLWSNPYTLGIQIEDNGRGFDFEAVWNSRHTFGLKGMRDRALLLGGRFILETQPGKGCRVTAEFPLSPVESVVQTGLWGSED